MNIEERVHKIIEKVTGATDLNNTQEIIQDLGADSLDHVELIMAIEKEFNIEVDDDEAEKIKTVGDVVKSVQDKVDGN